MHVGDVLKDYEHASGGLVFAIPVDVVLSEHNVIQPDVVFVRKERRHLIDMMRPMRVPPDLAIEVLSPSTEARDRGRKMELLARFGVPEYWIVDPVANTLEIYTNVHTGFVLADTFDASESSRQVISPTLPALGFEVSRIFEQ